MSKYEAMQARARKAGLWPISKEQAYYAGLEEGSAGHIRTDNSAVIERLERENRELRGHIERQNTVIFDILTAVDDGDAWAVPFEKAREVYNESPAQSLRSIQAEAVDAALRKYAQQWVEPQVKGPFSREIVHADIIEHADRLADMRNGEGSE